MTTMCTRRCWGGDLMCVGGRVFLILIGFGVSVAVTKDCINCIEERIKVKPERNEREASFSFYLLLLFWFLVLSSLLLFWYFTNREGMLLERWARRPRACPSFCCAVRGVLSVQPR